MRLSWLLVCLFLPFAVWAQGAEQQSISFLPISDRPVNSAPFPVVVLASSYLPVTLSVAGPAAINGRLLTLNGPGTVTVTASQAGNTAYAPTSASFSFASQPVTPQLILSRSSPLVYGTPVSASMLQAVAMASPMADPSADTATMARSGSSALNDPTPAYGPGSPVFRYEGATLSASSFPSDNSGWVTSNLPLPYGLTYRVAFTCDCQRFEISFQTRQAYYRLWVDGAWTSPDATQDAVGYPGHSFVVVQFPDRRPRQIKFSIAANAPFFGVSTPPGETLSAPQVPLGPTVMIFGDSWTGPTINTPAIGPAQPGLTGGGYPEALGEYFNWNYWTDGIGGSGFTQVGSDILNRTWVQRFSMDVCANNGLLDQLLILGSVNDDPSSEAAIKQAADTSLGELEACLPGKPIFFFGAQLPNPSDEAAETAASAAYPANLTYRDTAQQNLFYGSSTDSSTGNAYLYLNIHPTPLGHDFYAEALVKDMVTTNPALLPAPYPLFQPAALPGTYIYSVQPGALLPAGSHTLSVAFTPADAGNYLAANANVPLVVTQASTSITLTFAQRDGQVVLTGVVDPQIAGVPSGTLQFSLNGNAVGSAPLTGGTASLRLPVSAVPSGVLLVLTESYAGDANFLGSSASAFASFLAAQPDFSFTLTPPAAPIAPGSTATVPLLLTSINTFTGTLTAFCSGLPAGASCTLAGSPVQIAGGTQPTSLSLQIATVPTTPSAASSAAQKRPSHSWPQHGDGNVVLAAAMVALLRKPRLWLQCLHVTKRLCAAALASLVLIGCAVHVNSAPAAATQQSTPVPAPASPTTYTVEVTLAAQGTPSLTHTQPLTLQIL